jgi:hypothetical protein
LSWHWDPRLLQGLEKSGATTFVIQPTENKTASLITLWVHKMAGKQWKMTLFPSYLHLHGVEYKLVWRLVGHGQEKVLPLVI